MKQRLKKTVLTNTITVKAHIVLTNIKVHNWEVSKGKFEKFKFYDSVVIISLSLISATNVPRHQRQRSITDFMTRILILPQHMQPHSRAHQDPLPLAKPQSKGMPQPQTRGVYMCVLNSGVVRKGESYSCGSGSIPVLDGWGVEICAYRHICIQIDCTKCESE